MNQTTIEWNCQETFINKISLKHPIFASYQIRKNIENMKITIETIDYRSFKVEALDEIDIKNKIFQILDIKPEYQFLFKISEKKYFLLLTDNLDKDFTASNEKDNMQFVEKLINILSERENNNKVIKKLNQDRINPIREKIKYNQSFNLEEEEKNIININMVEYINEIIKEL
ncbi:hypothetical protein SLOPH_2460 [Spraguea lophii 42_110]|uniref:Uncharacterized protein n=1 Tax=Spraguea lophii (strain 42_110) TaxID=1358809 RepID=S7W5X5_SPRLO|nr:hypothetical protein SLOPH_2460 [Spraguea lophii 42_110]